MFPALVRYDEAERGMVEHAMRIIVKQSRQAYIYPASHEAGSTTAAQVPAMGQRLRLKSSFVIPASWTKEETAIAKGLQKYGALVADNGSFFSISICPDDRWPAGCFAHLSQNASTDFCDISNFEVVESTGPTGGPRSPGAPTANAGSDQSVTLTGGAALDGAVTGSGVTSLWYLYPLAAAPGTVTFGNAASAITTASFSSTGAYTLMLEASDGVHTPAFSYCTVTVVATANPAPTLTSISPTTAVQYSGAFTMTLTGTGFVPASPPDLERPTRTLGRQRGEQLDPADGENPGILPRPRRHAEHRGDVASSRRRHHRRPDLHHHRRRHPAGDQRHHRQRHRTGRRNHQLDHQ